MGRGNSSKGRAVKLAHPPGHIFWKKDPPVDKLSIYIERITEEQNGDDDDDKQDEVASQQPSQRSMEEENEELESSSTAGQETDHDQQSDGISRGSDKGDNTIPKNPSRSNSYQAKGKKESDEVTEKKTAEKVQRIVEKLYSRLFTDDLMFIKVFELPPKVLAAENGLYFRRINEKEFECKLFLKRLIDQNSCQLIFGAQSDIPPGMAIYKLNDRMTNEQKSFTKEAWGPCMDEDGYMSPGKMYPWFAMGLANCIQNIIDEEMEDNDTESASSNKEISDFEGIEVAGEFPLIRILIPVEKKEEENMQESKVDLGSLGGSDSNSHKSTTSLKKEGNEETKNETEKVPKTKAQWYPRGAAKGGNHRTSPSPTVTPRGSLPTSGRSSKTFSSFSSDVGTINEDIEEEPIAIIIKPAIKGYGLPKSIKLQHALPKQKPFCEKGKDCIKEIHDKIDDGQSMWFLEASPVTLTPQIENSARFRTTFRRVGKSTNFWNISFDPIIDIIEKNMKDAYEKHEFKIDLEQVRSCINIMKAYHGWSCISDQFINIGIMNIVKSNMLTMRSVGECTKKLLNFLHGVIASRSCPNFLQPNVNLAQGISEKEAKWVAAEMSEVIDKIEEDPGNILIYIGYGRKNEDS